MEIENDEWREHILSEEHLIGDGRQKCELCKLT